MAVYKGELKVQTVAGKPDYKDITKQIADIVAESGIKEGVATVISCHTTGPRSATRVSSTSKRLSRGPTPTRTCLAATAPCSGTATRTCAPR